MTQRHLHELGLSVNAAAVYDYLLSAGGQLSDALPGLLAMSSRTCGEAVDELQLLALILRDGDLVRPLDPTAGLQALSGRISAQLDVSVQSALAAYESYRRGRNTWDSQNLVEILEGADIQRGVAEVERSASSRIRAFDTPPYGTSNLVNPIELDNLRRGVAYQVLYAQVAVADSERFQQNILPCIEAGEVARSLPRVPAKMLLVDDRLALIGLTNAHADRHHTALLIHQCSVLPALSELFELCWLNATPLGGELEADTGLRPIERLLLRHLAAGLTDEAAARNLGISTRTVARYLERLTILSGASSRFQLALYARSHGWIA